MVGVSVVVDVVAGRMFVVLVLIGLFIAMGLPMGLLGDGAVVLATGTDEYLSIF